MKISTQQQKLRTRRIQHRVHQTFKEEAKQIRLKLFWKVETESTFANYFYDVTIILLSKPHKDVTYKTYRLAEGDQGDTDRNYIPYECAYENYQQNTCKPNSRTH